MRVRIDKADQAFSEYIRMRDGRCVRCGRFGEGANGIVGLQCSHYFGRRRENTRFDPRNADALCFGCHQIWGSEDREAYREFKIRQLGEKEYKSLYLASNQMKKKDRKMSLIEAKALLKTLKEK